VPYAADDDGVGDIAVGFGYGFEIFFRYAIGDGTSDSCNESDSADNKNQLDNPCSGDTAVDAFANDDECSAQHCQGRAHRTTMLVHNDQIQRLEINLDQHYTNVHCDKSMESEHTIQ